MLYKFTVGLAVILLTGTFAFAQPCGTPLNNCETSNCGGCGDCGSGCGLFGNLFSGNFFNRGCSGQRCGSVDGGCASQCETPICAGIGCRGNCGLGNGCLRLRGLGGCGGAACGSDQCNECCGCSARSGCRYTRGFIGWNSVQDLSTGPALAQAASFNNGWGMGFALGRYLNECTRAELEFTYRNNTGNVWATAAAPVAFDGQLNAYSGMANILRDIDRFQMGQTTPYIGGGIGVARLDGDFLVNGVDTIISETAVAMQGILGLSRPINQSTSAFLEYRFLSTDKVAVSQNLVQVGDFNYYSHSIFFGLQLLR